jgi:tRNA pseudouridine55 synthase
VLLLDKPPGLSSNAALQKARWLLRAEKAGHTGTLDPMATGLLPLCFGAATKFAQMQLDADKAYVATLKLGVTTTTGDAEGEPLLRRTVGVTAADVAAALGRFVGRIEQVPPMHSALKHEGRKLYELARAGLTVDREARGVTVHALRCERLAGDELVLHVHCSKGTYIRSLAEDIGEALGCGAHLSALRRTATGGFDLSAAVTLDVLEALPEAARLARLLPVDALLAGSAALRLDAAEAARFLSGLRRRVAHADAERVRVFGPEPGAFLGSGHVRAGELIADRLLSPVEVTQILSTTVNP